MKFYSRFSSFLLALFFFTGLNGETGFPVSEPNYVTELDLTRNIDINKPVYAIPAQVDVSNGNGSYTIPINISDGINGMKPGISIGYSSAGGYGLLGWGWNLSATSMISRTGKNHLFDGKVMPVLFTAEDNLALDGQRLILVAGTKFTLGSEYRTSIESFHSLLVSKVFSINA